MKLPRTILVGATPLEIRAIIAAGDVVGGLCPDCDSGATLVEVAPCDFVAVIEHDDTCPAYNADGRPNDRRPQA